MQAQCRTPDVGDFGDFGAGFPCSSSNTTNSCDPVRAYSHHICSPTYGEALVDPASGIIGLSIGSAQTSYSNADVRMSGGGVFGDSSGGVAILVDLVGTPPPLIRTVELRSDDIWADPSDNPVCGGGGGVVIPPCHGEGGRRRIPPPRGGGGGGGGVLIPPRHGEGGRRTPPRGGGWAGGPRL